MEEIYTCDKCGIRYYHQYATHENFHGIIYEKDGVNTFSCQVENCPDKLKTVTKDNVERHILNHNYYKKNREEEYEKCTYCDSYFKKNSIPLSNHYVRHIPIEFLNQTRGEFFDKEYFEHEKKDIPKTYYNSRSKNKKEYYRPIKKISKELSTNNVEMKELRRKMNINSYEHREIKDIEINDNTKKRKNDIEINDNTKKRKIEESSKATAPSFSAPATAPSFSATPGPGFFIDRYMHLNATKSASNCMQLAFSILLDIKNNFGTNPTLHEKNDESYGSLHPNVNEEGVIESSYSVDKNFSNFIKPLIHIDVTKETPEEESRFYLKNSNFANIDKILKDFPKTEDCKSYGIIIYTPKNFIEEFKAKKPVPLAHVVPWYSEIKKNSMIDDEHSLFYIDAQPTPVKCYENHVASDNYFNKNYISEVFYLVLSISKEEKKEMLKNAEMLKKLKIEPKGDGLLNFKVTKKSKKRSNISKRKSSKKKYLNGNLQKKKYLNVNL